MEGRLMQELRKVGVSVDEATERFMGNAALYSRFLLKFLDDKNMSLLEEAVYSKDVDKAFMAAHTIKGVAANLGLAPLCDTVGGMVELFRQKQEFPTGSEPEELYIILKKKYDEICCIIKNNSSEIH